MSFAIFPASIPPYNVLASQSQIMAFGAQGSAGGMSVNGPGASQLNTYSQGNVYSGSLRSDPFATIGRADFYTNGGTALFGMTCGDNAILSADYPFFMSNVANEGGFYCEIYAGIGDIWTAANIPAYFIGLGSTYPSYDGTVGHSFLQANHNSNICGLVANSTYNTAIGRWQWVAQNGSNAPTIGDFSTVIDPAPGQLFALKFYCAPGSFDLQMSISIATALGGPWTPLLTNKSLLGIGPATNQTPLTPLAFGQNSATATGNCGIFVNRIFADQISSSTVPYPWS